MKKPSLLKFTALCPISRDSIVCRASRSFILSTNGVQVTSTKTAKLLDIFGELFNINLTNICETKISSAFQRCA